MANVFVVHNGYRALLTIASTPLMSSTRFSDANISFFHNVGSNNFMRIYSSHFKHKISKKRHMTLAPYADTDVLQILCEDSALRSGLTKVHATAEQILYAHLSIIYKIVKQFASKKVISSTILNWL